MDTIVLIVLVIILIVLGLASGYIAIYNRLQKCIIRINEAESQIDDSLRKRYDILSAMEKIINEQAHLNQNNLNEFKSNEMSNFEVDRNLTKIADLFKKIYFDYEKELDIPAYKENVIMLKQNNEMCDAAKSYYNKYTTNLNLLVKKFPTNVIAKLHGINVRSYFDNKNLNDEDIYDFKI